MLVHYEMLTINRPRPEAMRFATDGNYGRIGSDRLHCSLTFEASFTSALLPCVSDWSTAIGTVTELLFIIRIVCGVVALVQSAIRDSARTKLRLDYIRTSHAPLDYRGLL